MFTPYTGSPQPMSAIGAGISVAKDAVIKPDITRSWQWQSQPSSLPLSSEDRTSLSKQPLATFCQLPTINGEAGRELQIVGNLQGGQQAGKGQLPGMGKEGGRGA